MNMKTERIKTGIPGFDDMVEKGIPRGYSILLSGGCGTGKTIFCLQSMRYACSRGEKCLYISFEESPERLKRHMKNFGWNPEKLENEGLMRIIRLDSFSVSRDVEALFHKAKGELMIEKEILEMVPKDFKPDRIFIDSITALAVAFSNREDAYRFYVEQFFRYLETHGTTTFLISETEEAPDKLSISGVEEFLADGVIILYHLLKGSFRQRAVEILKMRGTSHMRGLIPFDIEKKGIMAYPTKKL